jgi:hypothetical protein
MVVGWWLQARQFVEEHLATEKSHLELFDRLLDEGGKSRLLPLWRLSGWMLGLLPTLLGGEKGLFITIEAVETFVEVHFLDQVRGAHGGGVGVHGAVSHSARAGVLLMSRLCLLRSEGSILSCSAC